MYVSNLVSRHCQHWQQLTPYATGLAALTIFFKVALWRLDTCGSYLWHLVRGSLPVDAVQLEVVDVEQVINFPERCTGLRLQDPACSRGACDTHLVH